MKVSDLTEQLQRRKSPEELAAMKAAPDYWKKGIRKEFNDIIKKFGGTSRERSSKGENASTIHFDRDVSVLVSGSDSMTVHRDKRADALMLALLRWMVGLEKKGYYVSILMSGVTYELHSAKGPAKAVEGWFPLLSTSSGLKGTKDWLAKIGERGEKLPLRFDLRFTVRTHPL